MASTGIAIVDPKKIAGKLQDLYRKIKPANFQATSRGVQKTDWTDKTNQAGTLWLGFSKPTVRSGLKLRIQSIGLGLLFVKNKCLTTLLFIFFFKKITYFLLCSLSMQSQAWFFKSGLKLYGLNLNVKLSLIVGEPNVKMVQANPRDGPKMQKLKLSGQVLSLNPSSPVWIQYFKTEHVDPVQEMIQKLDCAHPQPQD